MTHGSLFSGGGGFDLAAEWMGWENAFHCEWIESKRKVLEQKWPNAKSYGDISKTDFTIWRGRIGILTGGFPCQDVSLAKRMGNGQQGLRGGRTGLFWEMLRAISEIKPKYVIAENVANFLKINAGADARTSLTEFARLGYNAEWRICRASEVGAPHHRARLYLVAYPNSVRRQKGQTFFSHVHEEASPIGWDAAGTTISLIRGGSWSTKPPILCVDDGLPSKLVREHIHTYGNAVVPPLVFKIFQGVDAHERLVEAE